MGILGLGISYRRAPIELLERLSFTDDDLVKAYRHARDTDGLNGAVIVSTCHRVEVYGQVDSYHSGFLALKQLLSETRGVDPDELTDPLYAHWEGDAAEHLFRVAAGLDSMVLGETQIHTQVREAIRRAQAEQAADRELTGLFHGASRAGRRARQETSLGAAPDAFVASGADIAAQVLDGLDGKHAVIVGAGQMASLSVQHLRARGTATIRVVNRSLDHARLLAARTGADYGDLEALPPAIHDADLVVSATGAAGHVIGRDTVATAMAQRSDRPLVLVDLAMPRDVDPQAASVHGVRVIDVVTLRERLEAHDPQTAADIERAHEIVHQEVRRWVVRRRSDELAPLIRALRERGDEIVRGELARFGGRLDALTPDERQAVESVARGIAAKLLHDPIVALKEHSEPGATHARVLGELLGIDLPDER
jgi:glutamyl-tRNA reductase